MASGFLWTCCDEQGDNPGCKSTKHKAPINLIVKKAPVVALRRVQKRKAVEAIQIVQQSERARCKRCHQRFAVYEIKRTACLYHPGTLEIMLLWKIGWLT